MNAAWIVFKKEWLDTLRDWRGLLSILITPLIFTAISYAALPLILSLQKPKPDFILKVINPEQAAPLIQALHTAGIKTEAFTGDDATEAVRSGETSMVLRIPASFEHAFREQRAANIELIWDISRSEHIATANRVKYHANLWFRTIGAQRLILRGVSPEVAVVGQVVDVNTAKEQQMSMRVFGSVPLFLVLIVFAACAGIATEMTAGEREGRTLEPLLLTPTAKYQLFLGKWLMACSLSLSIALLAVVGQYFAMRAAPVEELGLRLDIQLITFAKVFVLLLPMVALANSLALTIAMSARTLKASQTYVQFINMLPAATGVYVLLTTQKTTIANALIPVVGNQTMIQDTLAGLPIGVLPIVLNFLVCILVTGILGAFALRAFRI